ncbi:hypothetical protein O3P69_004962 [Scylla paramamosain]|uniref:Uncharacterized protein n=1 Tax=Scylla paramamosain TaxID=85552 RepID=A0AAW0UCU6_SCYPA
MTGHKSCNPGLRRLVTTGFVQEGGAVTLSCLTAMAGVTGSPFLRGGDVTPSNATARRTLSRRQLAPAGLPPSTTTTTSLHTPKPPPASLTPSLIPNTLSLEASGSLSCITFSWHYPGTSLPASLPPHDLSTYRVGRSPRPISLPPHAFPSTTTQALLQGQPLLHHVTTFPPPTRFPSAPIPLLTPHRRPLFPM